MEAVPEQNGPTSFVPLLICCDRMWTDAKKGRGKHQIIAEKDISAYFL